MFFALLPQRQLVHTISDFYFVPTVDPRPSYQPEVNLTLWKGWGFFSSSSFSSHNMCKCWNKVLISPIQYKTRLGCRVKTLLLPGSQNILNYRLLQGRVLYNIPSAWYSWIYGLREAVFLCIPLLFPAVLLAEQSLLIWRKMKGWLLLIDINKWKGREGWGEAV